MGVLTGIVSWAIQLKYYSGFSSRVEHYVDGSMELWVLPNFLPSDLAEQVFEDMEVAWGRREWLYTTNIPGRNDKIRGNHDIAERRTAVTRAYNGGHFSYSKHELVPSSFAYTATREYVEKQQVDLSVILNLTLDYVSDMFVAAYAKGDFLAKHEDNSLGSVAFVLSLTKHWGESDGGKLRFHCRGRTGGVCKQCSPKFNTMYLFRTRPRLIPHDVTLVTGSKNRYSITGWFTTTDDKLSPAEKHALEQERGRY